MVLICIDQETRIKTESFSITPVLKDGLSQQNSMNVRILSKAVQVSNSLTPLIALISKNHHGLFRIFLGTLSLINTSNLNHRDLMTGKHMILGVLKIDKWLEIKMNNCP
jgi:hypothetical protein